MLVSSHFGAVMVLRTERHQDGRGTFAETYNRARLAKCGVDASFLQDNQSLSRRRGTIRGLHFQRPPFAQAKLVRVLKGAIFDVALDIRVGSPSFGKHAGVVLSAENGFQIFVPCGFAHGFCSLEPDTEVFYKVDNGYEPAHEGGVRWDDPSLGIAWPVSAEEAVVSDKDRKLPLLAGLHSAFTYTPPEA